MFYIYNYTTVKVRLFCLLYCPLNFIYFLWPRHDHNKIAPCGMIKVFELYWTELKGEEISPTTPSGNRTRDLSIRSAVFYH